MYLIRMHLLFALILVGLLYSKLQAQHFSAHHQITQNHPDSALLAYQTTFLSPKTIPVPELHNALLLAVELRRTDTFFELLEFLLPKNLSNAYLREQDEFAPFHADPRWAAFLTKNAATNTTDTALRDTLTRLFALDQEFRRKPGSYRVYGDTIRVIDSLNMAYLYRLIRQGRFPGEDDIGATDFSGRQPYDVILHHYAQSTSLDTTKPRLTKLLLELVEAGKIPPRKAASWIDQQNHDDFRLGTGALMRFVVNGKRTGYYIDAYAEPRRKRIVANRRRLGLEPLDVYLAKCRHVVENPLTPYHLGVELLTIEVSEEQFERFASWMQPLKTHSGGH